MLRVPWQGVFAFCLPLGISILLVQRILSFFLSLQDQFQHHQHLWSGFSPCWPKVSKPISISPFSSSSSLASGSITAVIFRVKLDTTPYLIASIWFVYIAHLPSISYLLWGCVHPSFLQFLNVRSTQTSFIVGVCRTDCPCPTFVCQMAVSHASYLLSQYLLVMYLISIQSFHLHVLSVCSCQQGGLRSRHDKLDGFLKDWESLRYLYLHVWHLAYTLLLLTLAICTIVTSPSTPGCENISHTVQLNQFVGHRSQASSIWRKVTAVTPKSTKNLKKGPKIKKISYKSPSKFYNIVYWRNHNFIRQVTGHTGWRIDLIATVV